jgi:hypothetical protein
MIVYFAFRLSKIPQRGRRRKAKSIHLQWGLYFCSILNSRSSWHRLLKLHLQLPAWFFIDALLSRSTVVSERGSAGMKKTSSSAFSACPAKAFGDGGCL